jgi:glutamine---fructose-6-phosphate transaminase (isomerizing)
VAAVKDGTLTIHRIRRNMDDPNAREITIIKMEIQQIMKGKGLEKFHLYKKWFKF